MCKPKTKLKVYKQLRNTIKDLINLEGIEEVEKKLGIVVMGIRHSGIENIPNNK